MRVSAWVIASIEAMKNIPVTTPIKSAWGEVDRSPRE